MKCRERSKNNWRLLGGLFLSMLLVFTTVALAETGDPSSDVLADPSASATTDSSAGAAASAEGDVAIANAHITITVSGAGAEATARARASNGGTAIAIAEAWANFLDIATAHAYAITTVTAGIGEITWAEAYAKATAQADGTAYAQADSCTGENCLVKKSPDNNIGQNGVVSSSGGAVYSFGKSDVERYCHFKLQLSDNDVKNDDRAKYFIDVLTWDNGFSGGTVEFEQKYNIKCGKELKMEDNYK